MGRLEWARPCFLMQGNQQHSAVSKTDQIMAKYRPIAPKPPLSSLGKPASRSPLHFLSAFTPTHNSNSSFRSGYKRRSHFPHSPRLLKKARVGAPSLGISPDIVLSRVELHGQNETPSVGREVVKAIAFNGNSVLDERSDESVSTKVDDVSVSVDKVAKHEEKTLVTLPLLPPTPLLQNVPNHASSASSDVQGITLRLFGRDLGYKEVGSCQSSMNSESPEPQMVVPIVGLSFI